MKDMIFSNERSPSPIVKQEWRPSISIIIPSFNAHNTILHTLPSILMQDNIDEIETIIVDDKSDMDYDEIARLFAPMMKIKIVKMLKNGGPGVARQVGLDYASGDFIMYMDADDCLMRCDALAILKKMMIQNEMDIVYGQFFEQDEDGLIFIHEQVMVWVFGKLYRKSFLDKYSIRFNTTHSNEDTGMNQLCTLCTEKIMYLDIGVYTWRFKANSITRINQGSYGTGSGFSGWLDNSVYTIKEAQKRFVNPNLILNKIVSTLCSCYSYFCENTYTAPLTSDKTMNKIRGYYQLCYKDIEDLVDPVTLSETFKHTMADHNLARKGVIPKITFYDFLEEIKKPYSTDPIYEADGSTPAGYMYELTPTDWPVEIYEYFAMKRDSFVIDSNTNLARLDGMEKLTKMTTGTGLTEYYKADKDGTMYTEIEGYAYVFQEEDELNERAKTYIDNVSGSNRYDKYKDLIKKAIAENKDQKFTFDNSNDKDRFMSRLNADIERGLFKPYKPTDPAEE